MSNWAEQKRNEMRRRAVSAAEAVARSYGVHGGEPVVLHDLFSVVVHLAPSPVVARVPTWLSRLRPDPFPSLEREVAVISDLHDQGARLFAPSGELPAGPHQHDALCVTFSEYVRPEPGRIATRCGLRVDAARPAPDAGRFPGEVPTLGDSVVCLKAWLPHLETWAARRGRPGRHGAAAGRGSAG